MSGSLSDYFVGVGVKSLSSTEVDPNVANGHELQGIAQFRRFLGEGSQRDELPVTYVWLSDEEPAVSLELTGTWYNSRRKTPKRAAEYRFYYPVEAERVVYRAKAGDTLFICQPRNAALLVLFCQKGSSIERQLLFLFGLELANSGELKQAEISGGNDRPIDFVSRFILELINVEIVETEDQLLESLLRKFGESFPQTTAFSDFARAQLKGVDGRSDPDSALIAWVDFEERLFMTLEKHIVGERLTGGFLTNGLPDVESFIRYSLSVQNRRKSRAGYSLANHIEEILKLSGVYYAREATTEKRAGPDFLFPGVAQYKNIDWPASKLTMLGAKTSCKDRWRQVLAEADRIEEKHLLTLEPGISQTQTDEMRKSKLKLVMPTALHATFLPKQQTELLSVADFLAIVRSRQE